MTGSTTTISGTTTTITSTVSSTLRVDVPILPMDMASIFLFSGIFMAATVVLFLLAWLDSKKAK